MTKNELVPVNSESGLLLYTRMQAAISQCFSVDDCKDIATQAKAIAAYYAQIKDDESMKKYIQIKIRAWRRIGEILLTCGVDKSKCAPAGPSTWRGAATNTSEYIRRIRASFKGRKDIEELTDNAFRQALRIAEVPNDFFSKNVAEHSSIEGLVGAYLALQRREWEASPEGQSELKELERLRKQHEKDRVKHDAFLKEKQEGERRQLEEQKILEREEAVGLESLKAARTEAFEEVGITLERRDRENMHQIVFLIKDSVHTTLRQAAFDKHITMQAILRSGLMMWLIAHGYPVPVEDMKLPTREPSKAPKSRYGQKLYPARKKIDEDACNS